MIRSIPMIIADINNIARVHGGRTIFSGVSWTIQDGEKIGLVVQNGIGKSTLLRTLAGLEQPDAGAVTLRRGVRAAYLPQEYSGEPGRAVLDELLAARADLAEIEARIAAAEARMGDPAVAADMHALEQVLAEHEQLLIQFDQLGGPRLHSRAESLLREIDLEEQQWRQPMELLSGGQRKLVGLARCLLAEPDLLLLDETDSQIVEIEPAASVMARIKQWEGNYSAYVTQKELALIRQQQDYSSQQKEIERLEAAIVRFKVWLAISLDKRHKTQIENKQRMLERMDKVERPVLERRKMALQFRPHARGGAKAIELRHVDKAFGDKIILLDAIGTIMNGERVGIVGPNGAGKSVLLRMILGLLAPDPSSNSGQAADAIWVGPSMQLGYYAQQHETLDMRETPIEALRDIRAMYEGEAVAKLGRFLIPYAAASQPIAKLSGGEKSRVQLARLMLTGANCLL